MESGGWEAGCRIFAVSQQGGGSLKWRRCSSGVSDSASLKQAFSWLRMKGRKRKVDSELPAETTQVLLRETRGPW